MNIGNIDDPIIATGYAYDLKRTGSCYTASCSGITSKVATVIPSGVELWDYTESVYKQYYCGVVDGVCPDDFGNTCGVGTVCGATPDYDCNAKVNMSCGKSTLNNGTVFTTCNADPDADAIPFRTAQCAVNQCFFTDGTSVQCANDGGTITAPIPGFGPVTLKCHASKTVAPGVTGNAWCPDGYRWVNDLFTNPDTGVSYGGCQLINSPCSTECPNVAQLYNYLGPDGKPINAAAYQWIKDNYLNNPGCFVETNGRRTKWCGRALTFPEPVYLNSMTISVITTEPIGTQGGVGEEAQQ